MTILAPSRLALLAAAIGLSLALVGCETSDVVDKIQDSVSDFNPFGTGKKKLKGARQEVFPGGVPGVEQGIPPDLMVGAKPPPEDAPAVALAPEAKPKPEPKRKTATRHTPAPKTAARRKREPSVARAPAAVAAQPGVTATDPAWTTAPAAAMSRPSIDPSATASTRGVADPAWGSVPTTPHAAAAPQAARPAANGTGTWQSPPSQPVPTQWPDPK
jgi:hypothetical protein